MLLWWDISCRYSMIGVGDAVTTSLSTTELALEIKMTMLWIICFGSWSCRQQFIFSHANIMKWTWAWRLIACNNFLPYHSSHVHAINKKEWVLLATWMSRWKARCIPCNMKTKRCMHLGSSRSCKNDNQRLHVTLNLAARNIKLGWHLPTTQWWTTQNKIDVNLINNNWNLKIVFQK